MTVLSVQSRANFTSILDPGNKRQVWTCLIGQWNQTKGSHWHRSVWKRGLETTHQVESMRQNLSKSWECISQKTWSTWRKKAYLQTQNSLQIQIQTQTSPLTTTAQVHLVVDRHSPNGCGHPAVVTSLWSPGGLLSGLALHDFRTKWDRSDQNILRNGFSFKK